MSGGADQGLANLFQGDFGESWFEVVASGSKFLHGRPYRLDAQKTDVQIATLPTDDVEELQVQIQVKTAHNLHEHDDGTASYELDLADYNELRKIRNRRKLLAVIWLEQDRDPVEVRDDGTLLVGRGAWVSLEDLAATDNLSTVTVRLPLANTLDRPGLQRMLEMYGGARSTVIPDDVDWWSGA